MRVQGAIRLNNRSAPQPDIALLRERPLSEVGPYFPPDVYLVIEVADSSLSYDRGAKLARYAAAGVQEVWVVNLRAREVTAYTALSGSEYTTVRTYRAGDSVSPQAFPDLALAVDDFIPPCCRAAWGDTLTSNRATLEKKSPPTGGARRQIGRRRND